MKYNVLFFNEKGLQFGSTEKLGQLLAKHLVPHFNVYFAYGKKDGDFNKNYFNGSNVTLIPFDYEVKQPDEPHAFLGMRPALKEIINRYHIHCVYTPVYAHYQFPMNSLPASMPLVLVSPFGHYCTNGGVQKVYVSGKENLARVQKRAGKRAILDWHPLEDFKSEDLIKPPIGDTVTFGRIGRGDDAIFDPIALRAFAKLEQAYGLKVKYRVANPPPAWRKLAAELGVKNIEYLEKVPQHELGKFYQGIDVLAHARKDGETLGLAIAEAMIAGNPVLTHKSHFHNDHFDLLSSEYARWCEPDNVEGYYQNMVWMVEHKDHIRPMGQLARAATKPKFVIDDQLPEFIAVFMEACGHCTYYSTSGKVFGTIRLWYENAKAMPFLLGKRLARKFTFLEKTGRRLYSGVRN